jgi:hypothetical protein
MAADPLPVFCSNSTSIPKEAPRCCPEAYRCHETLCMRFDLSNNQTQQLCYSSDSDHANHNWSIIIIWPVVIFVVFVLATIAVWLWRRRTLSRRSARRPRNWNPSSRTTEEDRELPSYNDHHKDAKPWWISTNPDDEIEGGDRPPDYQDPELPKYPEVAFDGGRRRNGVGDDDIQCNFYR